MIHAPRSLPKFSSALPRVLLAGTVIGAFAVTFSISLAAIIFTGELSEHIYSGIAISLFSAVVLGTVLALCSSYPGTIGGPQDKTASILAVMALSIAGLLPGDAGASLFPTLFVCMMLSTAATAVVLFSLGAFKWGNTIRLMPHAVMGGFLAGTGWLLVKGAFAMMTGAPIAMYDLGGLFQREALPMWLPGFAFAIVLTVLAHRKSSAVVMPVLLVAGVAVAYAWLAFTGTSIDAARAGNFVLPSIPGNLDLPLLSPEILAHVDWSVVAAQLPAIGAVVVVSALSLLLYSSGLELAVNRDIDLNTELKASGIANALCIPAGGIAGFNILSDSLIGFRMGAASRATGLVAAGICAMTLVAGAALVSYFPIAVLAGLVLHLGFGFLIEWLYDARRTLPRHEYLLLVLIFTVVVTAGFLTAVVVGLIAAVLHFAATYSRINIVRHAVSGADYHSTVARTPDQLAYLRERGGQLLILRLQGFIFFGTAHSLTRYVTDHADGSSRERPGFVILDFGSVTGLDQSTLVILNRLHRIATAGHVTVILTGLAPELRHRLNANGFPLEQAGASMLLEDDLDHGVELAENRILADSGIDPDNGAATVSIEDVLDAEIHDRGMTHALIKAFERIEFQDGDVLIRQGDNDSDLYIIETGTVVTRLERPGDTAVRLSSSGPGTIIGDMAFCLGTTRSASVVAMGPGLAHRLSRDQRNHLEEQQPELGLHLYMLLCRRLARRVADTNRLLRQII